MAFDLDILTVPTSGVAAAKEVFGPVNAWPNAGSRVFVATYRSSPIAMLQVGYDPVSDATFMRLLNRPGTAWTAWQAVTGGGTPPTPPVPRTAVMINSAKTVLLHFSHMLNSTSVPPVSAFTVTRDAETRVVTAVRVSGTDVLVDISTAAGSGTVLVSYTPPATGKITSTDGIAAAGFSNYPVTFTWTVETVEERPSE